MITIESVSKLYDGSIAAVHALDDVSLEIPQGQFLSILGPSGCGKSTLLLLLAGLLDVSAGEIRIQDEVVRRPYTDLGLVFQTPVLLDWLDIYGNVMLQAKMRGFSPSDYDDKVNTLLEMVGLDGFARHRPHELSGGMQQRVAICRALFHEPSFLLMDEPFGALDALTRDQLNLDLLKIWNEARPLVIFVTHSITEAVLLSDRVVVMSARPGRIEEVIDINLPRPRRLKFRESQDFGAYVTKIRSIFGRLGILTEG